MIDVKQFFVDGGLIAKVKPDFKARAGQAKLAALIRNAALETGQHIIAQAPTGFGKSYAALVPAILLAAEGKRVVISTETIALQDQYVNTDLPLLRDACRALGIIVNFAVAKGRSNYVCRLKDDETGPGSAVQQWARKQRIHLDSGDAATIPFPYKPKEWQSVSADDDCERKACPFYKDGKSTGVAGYAGTDCFVYEAQRKYVEAQIIVTNHKMLLLDAHLGAGSLLGKYDVLIIDEAHTIPEQAQDTWGIEIRPHTVTNTLILCNKLLRKVGVNHFEAGFLDQYDELENKVFSPFQPLIQKGGSYYIKNIRDSIMNESRDAVRVLVDKLITENKLLKDFADEGMIDVIDMAREKIAKLISGLRRIYGDEIDPENQANWISFLEVNRSARGEAFGVLHLKPIDVAPLLRALILSVIPTVVFMSATMQIEGSFTFMRRELGLGQSTFEFEGASPFNYLNNVEGYFARDLPDPEDENYVPALARRIRTIIKRRNGRALVLFTSVKLMNEVYEIVAPKVPYECFVQGQASKASLLKNFQTDIGSCLFATKSFFQGIDVPGEACSTVILTRAPFRVPTDPLFKSKCDILKERGMNDFTMYAMPLMLMDVNQAFGRLIRRVDDKGFFAFLDSRAMRKAYGAKIKRSLPKLTYVETA